jgi:hypothetical protein
VKNFKTTLELNSLTSPVPDLRHNKNSKTNFSASLTKRAGSGAVCQRNRSVDPDPYQNAADPEHWLKECQLKVQAIFVLKNKKKLRLFTTLIYGSR